MPSLQEVGMFLDQMQVVLLQSKSVQERQQRARRIHWIKITNLQISRGIVTRFAVILGCLERLQLVTIKSALQLVDWYIRAFHLLLPKRIRWKQ